MSECGIISSAWACVRSQGHGGGHVYETRPVNDSLAAAEERGREEIRQAMDGSWSDERAQAEIRQAEERGRRAGIEERDELRAMLKEWLPRQCAMKPWPPLGSMLACGKCLGCRTLIALAPRDSGHEVGVLTDDNATRITAPKDRK